MIAGARVAHADAPHSCDPHFFDLQVVSAALWDAQRDLYSDMLVGNARLATLGQNTRTKPGELLAALFKYNGISIEHGYIEADKDGDGKVSEADLVSFCRDVQLECTDDDVRAFCRALDHEARGVIEPRAWSNALQTFEHRGERILASRGHAQDAPGQARMP